MPSRTPLLFCACCLFLAAACLPANLRAATVFLVNGDRLTGTITGYSAGALTLTTSYSPPIKIKTDSIRQVASHKPLKVVLTSGPTLVGPIRTTPDGRLAVAGPGGRPQLFTWDGVQAINPHDGLWKGSVTLGATLQSGNTDRLSSSFEGKVTRRTRLSRLDLHLLLNYAKEDGRATAQNIYWDSQYAHFFSPRLYSYLNLELLSDKFRDLRLRTVAGPGAGFQVWEDARKNLQLEAGIAYTREDYYDEGGSNEWVGGRLATTFGYQFNSTVGVTNNLVLHQRFDRLQDYRVRNETSIHSLLWSDWALKISNILEYTSTPADDADKTDLSWVVGLQYMF